MESFDRCLHAGATVKVRHLGMRPADDACGALEATPVHQLVLPLAGVFARHDGPRSHVVGCAGHALLFPAQRPYRISYPGALGDEVLVLDFDTACWQAALGPAAWDSGLADPAWCAGGLLSPAALLQRARLTGALREAAADALLVEEAALALLDEAVQACRARVAPGGQAARDSTQKRRQAQAEAVKALIALHPERPWRLEELAARVGVSAFHLARQFAQQVGMPIHRYQLHNRLARSIDAVLEPGSDLLAIALRLGFNSHSHFTAAFRSTLGTTPSALRDRNVRAVAQIRKRLIA